MGADQVKASVLRRRASQVKRRDRPSAPHDVDLVSPVDLPRLRFVEPAITLCFEARDRFGDRVERGGGAVDELEEILNWHVIPLLGERADTGAVHLAW